jgi:hypothetical protein
MDPEIESPATDDENLLPETVALLPWVKPAVESIPLNEATNGGSSNTFDSVNASS